MEHQDRTFSARLAAVASLCVASISACVAVWSARRGGILQRDIETLRATLTDRNAELNARRSYEYEARKRLYERIEPLAFQLFEASEAALHRIDNLAAMTAKGFIGPAKGWLRSDDYYHQSTAYLLLAPLAIFRLMQQHLTTVDLGLDRRAEVIYGLSKILYFSVSSDFRLAEVDPPIAYDPFGRDVTSSPAARIRQGVPRILVDDMISQMLIADADGGQRLCLFGEFSDVLEARNRPRTSSCAS